MGPGGLAAVVEFEAPEMAADPLGVVSSPTLPRSADTGE